MYVYARVGGHFFKYIQYNIHGSVRRYDGTIIIILNDYTYFLFLPKSKLTMAME